MDESSMEQNRLEVYLEDMPYVPDTLTAKVRLSVDQVKIEAPFQITIPIDKTKYATLKANVYPVKKEVVVDGQRFTIEQISVYPTQTEVTIQFDPVNTKRIFDFDQLRLVDEKGQTFAFWGNGVPSRPDGENRVVYNLESYYFAEPQKLYLKADGIRALEKENLQVIIDAKKGTLIQAPDSRLRLEALRQNGNVVGMDFLLAVEQQDENRFISFMHELKDDRGNEYELDSGSSSSGKYKNIQEYSEHFKRNTSKGMPSTYTFTLTNYPTRLQGDFSVQVK
jgi:hypothetical protein